LSRGDTVNCEEVLTFLWAYLSGELEPERAAAFDRHLEKCDGCTTYLDTYRQTLELTRGAFDEATAGVTEEDLPEDLVRAVLAARRSDGPAPE
jgi:anti-sigma factor RsiW